MSQIATKITSSSSGSITTSSLEELNDMLSDGYKVKFVAPIHVGEASAGDILVIVDRE